MSNRSPGARVRAADTRRTRTRSWSGAGSIVAVVAVVITLIAPTAGGSASAAPSTATVASAASASLDPTVVAQLEAALDQGFAASGIPGVIVGLWIPGQGEWVSTRGVSELGTTDAITSNNQQKIGSITKTIVGTVALQIMGEPGSGLDLDDTIDQWYPDFPLASQITVRMIMNMSSGIGESGIEQVDRICADPYAMPSPDSIIALGAATPRAPFAPGEGYQYSNFGTFILGRILEKVTGTDLGTLIRDRVTEPFGMTRSRFAPDGQVTAPLTHGYTLFCPQLPQPTDTVDWANGESWAAGAMVSTLDDLHAWGLALGAGAGVSPELQAARAADIAPGSGPGLSGYGLAVGVQRDDATGCLLTLSHSGAEPGYGTNVTYFQTTGAVFAMLGNGDGGTGVAPLDVVAALAPVLLPLASDPPTEPCTAPDPPATVPSAVPAATTVTPVVVAPSFTG